MVAWLCIQNDKMVAGNRVWNRVWMKIVHPIWCTSCRLSSQRCKWMWTLHNFLDKHQSVLSVVSEGFLCFCCVQRTVARLDWSCPGDLPGLAPAPSCVQRILILNNNPATGVTLVPWTARSKYFMFLTSRIWSQHPASHPTSAINTSCGYSIFKRIKIIDGFNSKLFSISFRRNGRQLGWLVVVYPGPAVQWVKIYIIICLASKISSLSFKLKIFSAHCPAGAALLRLLDKCWGSRVEHNLYWFSLKLNQHLPRNCISSMQQKLSKN